MQRLPGGPQRQMPDTESAAEDEHEAAEQHRSPPVLLRVTQNPVFQRRPRGTSSCRIPVSVSAMCTLRHQSHSLSLQRSEQSHRVKGTAVWRAIGQASRQSRVTTCHSPSPKTLYETGITASISSIGDAMENTLMEPAVGCSKPRSSTINRPMNSWRQAETGTLDWLHCYSNQRPTP